MGQPEPMFRGEELQGGCGQWMLGLRGALRADVGMSGDGERGILKNVLNYKHCCLNVVEAHHGKKYYILRDCTSPN